MRTQMNSRWSMGLAAAFLVAMTSTLSAQATESHGGLSAPSSSAQTQAANPAIGQARVHLDGEGLIFAVPLVSGWCGTDTSVLDDGLRVRMQLRLVAMLLASGTDVLPGSVAMKMGAFRRWFQSSIDVLPH